MTTEPCPSPRGLDLAVTRRVGPTALAPGTTARRRYTESVEESPRGGPRLESLEQRLEKDGPERDVPADDLLESEQVGPSDHDLIRRAQAGEEEAFADLVRRHQARAWRVARNMVPSEEDAQDLAQEAFLRVFRNLERFDFQHEFTTWLYRIVSNLAIDHLRKRRPAMSTASSQDDEEVELDLPDVDADRPHDGLEREETAAEVHACLATLAPHFQAVMVLRELEGLACTEIARIVGATHVTVRWRLHRGRKLFQEEWERRRRLAEIGPEGADSLREQPPRANRGDGTP